MRFDATLIGLIITAMGTLVVAVGAVVAIWQLRSIRHGNELATLTQLAAQFDAPEMIEACAFVRTELAAAMLEPEFVAELEGARSGARVRHVLRVANFFETMGVYLHYGALSKGMTFTIWGVLVSRYWLLMRDAVVVCRRERVVLRFFEDFATRADRWLRADGFSRRLNRLTRDGHQSEFEPTPRIEPLASSLDL